MGACLKGASAPELRGAVGTLLGMFQLPADVRKSVRIQGHELEERAQYFGLPTAALCPPGQCAFGGDWSPAELADRRQVTHDMVLLTFSLPDERKPLGLATCGCLLARHTPEGGAEPVIRPYTPVSTNAMHGRFELFIKVYEHGLMTQHLKHMPLGGKLDFRHTADNLKIQYPFGRKNLTMLAGGAGITPMLQVLHAVLGTPGDETRISLIFSNKKQEDILCEGLLDTWSSIFPDRLHTLHVLSRAQDDDEWEGSKGRIHRGLIEKYCAAPSEDVLVMVCGPAPMYDFLCGPREAPALTGLLADMGFAAEQVVKF